MKQSSSGDTLCCQQFPHSLSISEGDRPQWWLRTSHQQMLSIVRSSSSCLGICLLQPASWRLRLPRQKPRCYWKYWVMTGCCRSPRASLVPDSWTPALVFRQLCTWLLMSVRSFGPWFSSPELPFLLYCTGPIPDAEQPKPKISSLLFPYFRTYPRLVSVCSENLSYSNNPNIKPFFSWTPATHGQSSSSVINT